ncbi:MAG TPA: universal stress protein [Gemmatimonadaceae bacterium]|nr:universal stress protein [Gemmatimonadaceae bacterium]
MPKHLTKARPAAARSAHRRLTLLGGIVVGTDAGRATAAVRLAGALARRQGTSATAVPAADVLEEAHRVGASMIVVGIGTHRAIDRMLRHEPVLAVARGTSIPVLAAAPRASRVPRHALIATDFTDSSLRSARLVASLVDARGVITIVHVQPLANLVRRDGVSWSDIYATGARERLSRMREELEASTRCRVDTELVAGDTADALLDIARRKRCDLIAVGAHVHTALDRMLIGSTTTRLLRGAPCSVLVVPERREEV